MASTSILWSSWTILDFIVIWILESIIDDIWKLWTWVYFKDEFWIEISIFFHISLELKAFLFDGFISFRVVDNHSFIFVLVLWLELVNFSVDFFHILVVINYNYVFSIEGFLFFVFDIRLSLCPWLKRHQIKASFAKSLYLIIPFVPGVDILVNPNDPVTTERMRGNLNL